MISAAALAWFLSASGMSVDASGPHKCKDCGDFPQWDSCEVYPAEPLKLQCGCGNMVVQERFECMLEMQRKWNKEYGA